MSDPGIRIGVEGLAEGVALDRLDALRDEAAVDDERGIDSYRLRVPLEQDEADEELFEAYRRMAREWNVAEVPPIDSPRPWIGPLVTRFKRLVRRIIAFDIEPAFERQARFNRAALDLVRLLLVEIQRLRSRVRELEARPDDGRGDG